MELLPTVLPAVGYGLGRRVRERRTELGRAGLVDVDGQLDPRVELALLEPGGRVLDEPRASDLRLGRRDDEGDADEPAQRRALFSRLKKPPSS